MSAGPVMMGVDDFSPRAAHPQCMSITLASADAEAASNPWITVQTVISTLIEIETYDSPHEQAGSQPERPWVHAGHHEAPMWWGRLRRSCRASRSRCRPLICRDAATSWTRAASAGLPAAGRAGARGDWRSLTDVDDLEHPKPQAACRFSDSTGCRHGGGAGDRRWAHRLERVQS